MKPSDKCTNNTGFSFSSGNGTSLGWDSNGTPCSINANKPTTTSIGSYYPNVSSGYNATARSYIGGLDDRFEPFKLTESTNPYLKSSSSFPTFTPPQLPLPQPFPDQHIVSTNNNQQNISSELVPYFASHSGKVIGWLEHQNNTLNLNFNIAGKDLDMSNKQITDENMLFFCQKMTSFTFHFDNLIISNNLMTNLSVQYLFNATLTSPTNRTIKNLDLRNNQIGDVGAELIAAYLKHGYMPATTHVNLADNIITDKGALCFAESLNSSVNKLKVLHLEGNKISSTGEKYFVTELLNKATQHMIVYTQSYKGQFDEHVKMIFGNKEERAIVYKKLIAQGVEKGVNTKAIVVDQTLYGKIVNGIDLVNTNFKTFTGFIKCNFDPIDMIKSYAADKIIAKLPKSIGKLMGEIKTTEDAVSCYFEAHNEAWTSEVGVSVLTHELRVMGEDGFGE